jgi:hypothetical protein
VHNSAIAVDRMLDIDRVPMTSRSLRTSCSIESSSTSAFQCFPFPPPAAEA